MHTPQQTLDLALQLHRERRFAEAEQLYRQLLAQFPASVDLLHLVGVVAYDTGRLAEALPLIERSIALQPNTPHYYSNFGLLLADLHRYEEAVAALETGLRLAPAQPELLYNLGTVRTRQQQWAPAIEAYHRTIQLQPGHLKAWLNLGVALSACLRLNEALAIYRQALGYFPDELSLLVNFAGVLQDSGQLDEALEVLRRAAARHPGQGSVLNNLGTLQKDRGEIAEAVATLRQSLALLPNSPEVHSNLIFTLHFDVRASAAAEIQRELQLWNERQVRPLQAARRPHPNDPDSDRPLRVGYISADFRQHAVGRTLLPIFEAHDPQAIHCLGYSTGNPDAITERFRAASKIWHNVTNWTDEQIAERIREDRVDILVDLSLHTAYHRLRTFALKPAPVQLSWLGYPGSNGLETMDYRLTDACLEPPAPGEELGSEKPYRLPQVWCCYPAPPDSPEVGDLPMKRTGLVTFGSLNNFAKINDRVLEVWSRLLHRVPNSRLLLLSKGGNHRARVVNRLVELKVEPGRIQFFNYEAPSAQRGPGDYLRRYHEIDLALDPFPYNGMTTTGDALWMGVPVIALRGASPISRASFSLLSTVGLPELAAPDEEGYLAAASALAADLPRLETLRRTLRQRMSDSPLLQPMSFGRTLEAAYRDMWRRWCQGRT